MVGGDDGLFWHMFGLGNASQGLARSNDDGPCIGCDGLRRRRLGRSHSRTAVQENRRRSVRSVSAGYEDTTNQQERNRDSVLTPSLHVLVPVQPVEAGEAV